MLTATLQAAKALLEDAGYRVFHKDRLALHNKTFQVVSTTAYPREHVEREIAYMGSRVLREIALDMNARGAFTFDRLQKTADHDRFAISCMMVLPENNR